MKELKAKNARGVQSRSAFVESGPVALCQLFILIALNGGWRPNCFSRLRSLLVIVSAAPLLVQMFIV
jgi:hypothetical protein